MKAIKVQSQGTALVVSDAPIPSLENKPDYILADAKAWAINPTDLHHINVFADPGCTIGCDWAGVVRAVGANVKEFEVGDEVFGVTHGGNILDHEDGAFGEVIAAKEYAVFHKPSNMSFEEAATLGVSLATIGQAMYLTMQLENLPRATKTPQPNGKKVLIYGASSATGAVAVQIAKLAGFDIITTSSPSNFEMLQSRGADHTFDYKSPTAISEIRSVAGDNITIILDCIGNESTTSFCANLISSRGGKYHTIKAPICEEAFKKVRPGDDVALTSAMGYMLLGEDVELKGVLKVSGQPEQYAFAKEWNLALKPLLEAGLVVGHPITEGRKGLEGLEVELRKFGGLSPSGKKVVCAAA